MLEIKSFSYIVNLATCTNIISAMLLSLKLYVAHYFDYYRHWNESVVNLSHWQAVILIFLLFKIHTSKHAFNYFYRGRLYFHPR